MSGFRSIVILSGGVGGARLVHGIAAVVPAETLTVIVNTGDDFVHWGLTICPDLDTVMYTLAGLSHVQRGWGLAEESFAALSMIERYGGPAWFQLGDRDLGTHITRTHALASGQTLTQVTRHLCTALDIGLHVLPMSDHPQPTYIQTVDGRDLVFQDWFVRERCRPAIRGVESRGAGTPARAAIDALASADLIVLCPSNPYVSIDPILQLSGIRDAIGDTLVVGVSPIVHGKAVKGPLAAMIRAIGDTEPSAGAVLAHYQARYRGLISGFMVATGDDELTEASGVEPVPVMRATDIVMRDIGERERLARELLEFAESIRR